MTTEEYAECAHDDDVDIVDLGKSSEHAMCLDCGAVGMPDGPDERGRQSWDWAGL